MHSNDQSRKPESLSPPDHVEVAAQSEILHRLLVESVHDYAIFALTESGHVATWNPGAERLKGYRADEIIGKHFSIFYPPEERNGERPRRELAIAREDGRFEEEAWRVRKDGSSFLATVIVSPVRDGDGSLLGFAKVTRDLSIRRKAEQRERELEIARASIDAARTAEQKALQYADLLEKQSRELEARNEEAQALAEELEISNEELQNAATSAEEARDAAENAKRRADELQQRYQRIFESSPLPMWTVALDTVSFLDVNDAALQRYGYTREAFLSMNPRMLRHPDEAELFDEQLRNATGTGGAQIQTRHVSNSGEVFDAEVRAREIMVDGKPAMVSVVSDITDQLREQARQQFLLDATALLSGSLDYLDTVKRIVRLAVPTLADWAAYNVRNGDLVRTVAIHHPDPEMERLAAYVEAKYPARMDDAGGSAKVLATGVPELIREIPDDLLRAVARDDEHYAILKSVGFRSLINVPVVSRGEVLGVLGFATGQSNRLFTEDDLNLAIEVARRAAMALENAKSFEAEHIARDRAERNGARLARLQRAAEKLSASLDVQSTTDVIVSEALSTVGADAAYLASRCPDPGMLELVHGSGYPMSLEHVHSRFELSMDVPGAEVVRTGKQLWLESHTARDATFPALAESPISKAFGSSVTLPLIVHGETVGALGMHFVAERVFDVDDRSFIRAFAEQAGLALERARLFEAERRARSIAERLQEVTASLSEAVTPAQVTEILLTAGLQALGAGAGVLAMLRDDGPVLDVIRTEGFAQSVVEPYRTMRLDQQVPITEAIRTGEPVWVSSVSEWEARFPALARSTTQFRAWAALPLFMDGMPRGAIGLSFHEERAIAPEQRDFMVSLTRQCAQALERARLFDAEQRARTEALAGQERAELLAEFSRQLGSSLDYHATLEAVAGGAVPRLADWCAVDMLVDHTANSWPPAMHRVAVVHSDPKKVEWARELERRMPQDWSAPAGLPRVMRDGVTEFFPVITDELLVASAKSDEELAVLREVGFTAYICVPLKVSGRTVGAITLVMADSKRHYTDADVALVEELGTRASLAVENAELFREAQHANAAKAQFLAVMSHELRTPLNAIGGYAELLELGVRGSLNAEQLHDVHRIQRSQHHLLALINDVLNFARIEAGHVQYHIEDVALGEVLDEVVSLMAPQATARKLTVRIAECAEGAVAIADSEKLQQVLRNLLSNALKFTLPGGLVTLRCHLTKNTVEIRVTDTGIGIPADRLQAIFDPFVQVQSGLTRSSEGTGLGLSISRDLARGMRGDLRVESELDAGSTFTLTLPRRR